MKPVEETHTCREMFEAAAIVEGFDPSVSAALTDALQHKGALHVVGEGSSRKFPAKNLISLALRHSQSARWPIRAFSGSAAMDVYHNAAAVVFMSNSGRTHEVLTCARRLKDQQHTGLYAVTAFADSALAQLVGEDHTIVMRSGEEQAVAATKTVMEQGLILQSALESLVPVTRTDLQRAATQIRRILSDCAVPPEMAAAITEADTVYFAGPENGAASELALKFSETCGRAFALHGTDVVHGFQQNMGAGNLVVLIDPKPGHEKKFRETLIDKAGLRVAAVASRPTSFPTLLIPESGNLASFFHLAAGWRLLLERANGLAANGQEVDIDNPSTVLKIGFEAEPGS